MNLIYDKEGKGRGRNAFVVKLLRDQICASLGSSWVVKHQLTCTRCEIWIGQGFDSSPRANQVKSLSRQHKQQFEEGKGKPFIWTGCASSHSRGTEEVIQVRKCQDVEMREKGAWGLPWPHARWQPWVLAIISIRNPTTTADLHTWARTSGSKGTIHTSAVDPQALGHADQPTHSVPLAAKSF